MTVFSRLLRRAFRRPFRWPTASPSSPCPCHPLLATPPRLSVTVTVTGSTGSTGAHHHRARPAGRRAHAFGPDGVVASLNQSLSRTRTHHLTPEARNQIHGFTCSADSVNTSRHRH
ncbi:unnamed protein product [Protopolystoma xenopodis]|uniref:Uncharacterized protein n=1 Tax=Protopolystoma xenopodis TaxID=117903 RepID=A0A3S5APV7_9PLAT|nr:unnamed protein product [Protopolystoma xenopodis]